MFSPRDFQICIFIKSHKYFAEKSRENARQFAPLFLTEFLSITFILINFGPPPKRILINAIFSNYFSIIIIHNVYCHINLRILWS